MSKTRMNITNTDRLIKRMDKEYLAQQDNYWNDYIDEMEQNSRERTRQEKANKFVAI